MTRPRILLLMCGPILLAGGFLAFWTRDAPIPAEMHADDVRGTRTGLDTPLSGPGPATPGAAPSPEGRGAASLHRSVADATLHGRIVDASGRAVERGSLILRNERGSVHVIRLEPRRPEYEIANVRPGRWTASVLADGYAPQTSQIEIDGRSARVRHDVLLAQGVLDVRLAAEGGPLRARIAQRFPGRTIEVEVIATRGPPGKRAPAGTETDGSRPLGERVGRYRRRVSRSDRPIDGTMRLFGLPPVHISALFRGRVLATVRVPRPTHEVALVVPLAGIRAELASLRACFLDAETARPIRGAAAVLLDAEGLARQAMGDFTDRDGSLVLADQPPGRWTLQVVAAGYERFRRTVALRPGQTLDLGALILSRAVAVTGRVVDTAGRPVLASVACHPTPRPGLGRPAPRTYRTRQDGSFRIPDVGRSGCVLIAHAPGFAPAKTCAETSKGNVPGLHIVLERGVAVTIDHRIQQSNRYRFEVLDETGWLLSAHEVRSFAWPWRLRLLPGRHVLRVHDRGRLLQTLPLTMGAEPLRRTLELAVRRAR